MLIKAPGGFYGKNTCCWKNPSQAREHVKKRNKIWLENNSGGNTCQFPVDKTSTVCFMNSQQEGGKHLRSLASEKIKNCRKGKTCCPCWGEEGITTSSTHLRWPSRAAQMTALSLATPAEAGSQLSKHFVGATPQTQSHLSTLASPGLQASVCSWGLCFSPDAVLFHPGCPVFHSPKYLWDQRIWNQWTLLSNPGHLIWF